VVITKGAARFSAWRLLRCDRTSGRIRPRASPRPCWAERTLDQRGGQAHQHNAGIINGQNEDASIRLHEHVGHPYQAEPSEAAVLEVRIERAVVEVSNDGKVGIIPARSGSDQLAVCLQGACGVDRGEVDPATVTELRVADAIVVEARGL
jgi:hypothetical protein